jgi:threonine/homoserine/homoserine lactone efflux protein
VRSSRFSLRVVSTWRGSAREARSASFVVTQFQLPVRSWREPHALREGMLVNLLSPPIITFYLAVVPTFVPAGVSPWYYALLAGTHVGMAFIVHNGWVFALDRLRHVLEHPVARLVLEGLTAAALLVFAVRVLSGLVG